METDRMAGTLLIIGAAGDVGQGIVRAAIAAGWTVIASGRNAGTLEAAFGAMRGERLRICVGDVATEDSALALWDVASAMVDRIDAVVVSVNAPNRIAPLQQWTSEEIVGLLGTNLLTHFNAVKVMLPRLPTDGILLGIGGGTADFVIPEMAAVSVAQAGLRMLYRGFARERTGGAQIRELMIISMVNGASKRDKALPEWVTDDEVGQHICAILATPDQFAGPILQLKTRDQVGRPDPTSSRE
jgi:NAD(P)-dependent dehydrogenase (short-subunit alcohol dehydrogenase family)